jgi:hypothetical protein
MTAHKIQHPDQGASIFLKEIFGPTCLKIKTPKELRKGGEERFVASWENDTDKP